jgi:hypothetical protein
MDARLRLFRDGIGGGTSPSESVTPTSSSTVGIAPGGAALSAFIVSGTLVLASRAAVPAWILAMFLECLSTDREPLLNEGSCIRE